jgi:hypothetical protein
MPLDYGTSILCVHPQLSNQNNPCLKSISPSKDGVRDEAVDITFETPKESPTHDLLMHN